MTDLAVENSPIPGLVVLRLPVHEDNRGWFKENWQRAKMTAQGLPDFGPVQNNVSFNAKAGTTRGLHAEPWDKFVSVAAGRIFGAWVDLREGESFGRVFTREMGPETAVFVPRGVANGFQTLQDATAYTYLVNDHWSEQARKTYKFVNVADPSLGIAWPIRLDGVELSEADRAHPKLAEVEPFPRRRTLVIGAGGQIGRALVEYLPDAVGIGRSTLDLTSEDSFANVSWSEYDTVVNAAAYTAVDEAETPDGRRAAWETNVTAVRHLAELAAEHRATFVHYSSDYVFDGSVALHSESEPFTPLGVYGQTKAAGDALIAAYARHYIVRTSWVVGEGNNFVRTMAKLADQGVNPSVIDDQIGRLSFADDVARATRHLLETGAPYGTYNVSSSGPPRSWADMAAEVFAERGRDSADIARVSTEEYAVGKSTAPRPLQSILDLGKIQSVGFHPADGSRALAGYLARIKNTR
jgi:dTDP-4-dehydrorhamnose 3,5-epimerase/reductase